MYSYESFVNKMISEKDNDSECVCVCLRWIFLLHSTMYVHIIQLAECFLYIEVSIHDETFIDTFLTYNDSDINLNVDGDCLDIG